MTHQGHVLQYTAKIAKFSSGIKKNSSIKDPWDCVS